MFLGFPLHPAGKPAMSVRSTWQVQGPDAVRAGHARRDGRASTLIESTVGALGPHATLHWVSDGDHSLRMPARSGRDPAQVLDGVFDTIERWIEGLAERN